MRVAPGKSLLLISLLIPVSVVALVSAALGQGATPGPPCVSATGNLQAYATRLDHVWGTRTTLLVCDGARVPFGSHATPGRVFFVPQQARDLRFDGVGIVYLVAHEWGHQVQFQRLGMQNAFTFNQQRELQADCLAGYFIGAILPYAADTERRLMSAAAIRRAWSTVPEADLAWPDPGHLPPAGAAFPRASRLSRQPVRACFHEPEITRFCYETMLDGPAIEPGKVQSGLFCSALIARSAIPCSRSSLRA